MEKSITIHGKITCVSSYSPIFTARENRPTPAHENRPTCPERDARLTCPTLTPAPDGAGGRRGGAQASVPDCLLRESDEYSVVDGNHRLGAYWYFRALSIQSDPGNTVEAARRLDKYQTSWKIDILSSFNPVQKVWVATRVAESLPKSQV